MKTFVNRDMIADKTKLYLTLHVSAERVHLVLRTTFGEIPSHHCCTGLVARVPQVTDPNIFHHEMQLVRDW